MLEANETAGGSGTSVSAKETCSPFPSCKVRRGASSSIGEVSTPSTIAIVVTGEGEAASSGVGRVGARLSALSSFGSEAAVVVTVASTCERLETVSVSSDKFYRSAC